MRPISRVRRTIGVMGCLCAVVAAAACGSDDPVSSGSPRTVTVSQTAPATATDSESQAQGGIDTPAPPEDAGEATPAVSQPFVNEADVQVDANSFYGNGAGGMAYYFQSPTGNIKCGIGFADRRMRSGCMALSSVPSNTGVTCKNAGSSLYAMVLLDTAARSNCVNQPVYMGNSQNADAGPSGGKVLRYGEFISVAGVTCRSISYGINCTPEAGGFGFVLAKDRNNAF